MWPVLKKHPEANPQGNGFIISWVLFRGFFSRPAPFKRCFSLVFIFVFPGHLLQKHVVFLSFFFSRCFPGHLPHKQAQRWVATSFARPPPPHPPPRSASAMRGARPRGAGAAVASASQGQAGVGLWRFGRRFFFSSSFLFLRCLRVFGGVREGNQREPTETTKGNP